MATSITNSIKTFKGLKNDEDIKHVPLDYFYRMKNFNYSDKGLSGIEKIRFPEQINQIGTDNIDGMFEYRFLSQANVLETINIGVTNGGIYKDVLTSPVLLKSGLNTGKVSFVVFNDKLYIANGKNYINIYNGNKDIVTEMGAPEAEVSNSVGNLNGAYYYAMTYTTAGGEEVLGSISNTVNPVNNRVNLSLPLGYTGTLSRSIYRIVAGGTELKFVVTIGDNTTLTYEDNIADGALGSLIPTVNNELPKPFFLTVANQKIFAAVVVQYPTQVFITDTNIDVIDTANSLDVGNYGFDNTPVKGIGSDFNNVIVGTEKNIFFVNPADNSVVLTRANIGIKNGYTVRQVPATAGFPGGLMFVSTLNDVRVMSGLQALPVSTSVDNVRTENWGQNIRGSLENDLRSNSNLYAEFHNYRYHLLASPFRYVFDIRNNSWTYFDITTENYQSQPQVLSVLNNFLYNGQNDGWIEQEDLELTYRGEDVEAYIESPYIDVSTQYKFIEKMTFWFLPSRVTDVDIEVIADNNDNFKLETSFNFNPTGTFNHLFFDELYFEADRRGMDYKVVNINNPARWIKYRLSVTKGGLDFEGFEITVQPLLNKE